MLELQAAVRPDELLHEVKRAKQAAESKLEEPPIKQRKIADTELEKTIGQVIALKPLKRLLMRAASPASALRPRDRQESGGRASVGTTLEAGGREPVALWNGSITLADIEAEIERRTNQLKFLVQQRNEQLAKMEREEQAYEITSAHYS